MPVVSCSQKFSAWRDKTAWAGRRVNSAWKVPTTSHLQKESQRPGLRHCQVFFVEPPSQTFYEIGITPKPEKSLGPSYILKGMSNKSRHSLRDCPQSKELACSLLLLARVLSDGEIPCCLEYKEQGDKATAPFLLLMLPLSIADGWSKYAKFSSKLCYCYVAQSGIMPV